MSRRKWYMVLFASLVGLALACEAEPGAKPGPHDCGDSHAQQTKCTPAAKPTKTDNEGRYKITVEGSTYVTKLFGENVFINHNGRGALMNESVKKRLLDGRILWTDIVRAPKSRTWYVEVRAIATAPKELIITCKIEILGGPHDGGNAGQPKASDSGGIITCMKPSGV